MAIIPGETSKKHKQKENKNALAENDLGSPDSSSSIEKSEVPLNRPQTLTEMVGRKDIKDKLEVLIKSAKSRGDVIEHLLFYGPPGLGKTTFGYAISNEFGSTFYMTSGPSLNSKAELASIITGLNEGDILFVDEIHRLNKILEEFLYPILEDFKMDINFGKGTLSKLVRLDVPKFTLIGATTQIGLISAPLRDRFGMTFKVDFFELADLTKIVMTNASKLNVEIAQDAAVEIAKRSRGTARLALRNLRRARDYAISLDKSSIDFHVVESAFKDLEIDELGLDLVMRKYLEVLHKNFGDGPVGVSNIAASIFEDMRTIEEVYEPYLIKLGFLKRTPQGRVLTEKGIEYISGF